MMIIITIIVIMMRIGIIKVKYIHPHIYANHL